MKVLNVQITLDPVHGGGTAERTFQMSRALARSGVQTTVLTTTAGLDEATTAERAAALNPARLVLLPQLQRRFNLFRYSARALRQLVGDHDIVHLMGHWNVLNVVVARIARHLGKPYVCSPAGELTIGGRSRALKRLFQRVAGQDVLDGAAGYIAITAAETPQFAAYGIGRDRVTVIPNGIASDEFVPRDLGQFREAYGLGASPYLLFVGGLAPFKGPDLLLEAFLRKPPGLDPYTLLFVGPDRGGMLGALRERARAAGAETRVRFIGYLRGANKWAAYAGADLLVIPSRHEAMSIVALEAGVAGTPVLLTDTCGFPAVAEVRGGRVVPATVDGLYAGLAGLLSDRAALPRLGENLRQYVLENYEWEHVVQRFIELYEKVLTSAPSKGANEKFSKVQSGAA